MISCTRRVQFCSGHRVFGHEGKCRHLHGHNYVAFITAQADELDAVGRVIDFSVLKERIGGWIDREWDHGCVLWEGDSEAIAAVGACQPSKIFRLPTNPTAENMADHLLRIVSPMELVGTGVRVVSVRLWETENCYAEAGECIG
ncbi:MAG: 6-carboxytetrahydropterin synthase [Chloroflexi bacterium]|nr:6-carboxytetrahydropterin synthase [Chloroflexota bacterium]